MKGVADEDLRALLEVRIGSRSQDKKIRRQSLDLAVGYKRRTLSLN